MKEARQIHRYCILLSTERGGRGAEVHLATGLEVFFMDGGEGRGVYPTLLQWEEESQNRPTTSRLLKLIQFNSNACLFWPCLVAVSATQALHLPPTLDTPHPSAPQADLLNLRSGIDSQSVLSPPVPSILMGY